ncbi:hypothetical protein HanPSC8_Chr09g0376851 [Helianthus annuus]|nr:hypothetical protein HanPSC8_Chr09g0376851 [Helianthus annuus]
MILTLGPLCFIPEHPRSIPSLLGHFEPSKSYLYLLGGIRLG